MEKGHPFLYGVVGALTTPVGGSIIAGVLYANAAREVNELRGIPDNSLWHNPVFAGVMGFLFPGISGFLYGYAYGQKETQLGYLHAAESDRLMQMHAAAYGGYAPMPQMGVASWRDRLAAQEQSQAVQR